jgi:hypothetical protein
MLAPNDPEIKRWWESTHAAPMTPEQQIADIAKELQDPAHPLTPEQREAVEDHIKELRIRGTAKCEVASNVNETTLPVEALAWLPSTSPAYIEAAGLSIYLNGKRKLLELDTGASGLTITRAAAKAAGLVSEGDVKIGGIGDRSPTQASLAHVDDIRVGALEFKNCMVHVVDEGRFYADGLIGADVFQHYVVTLDIPGRQLRLAPLPKRPDEQNEAPATLQTTTDAAQALSYAARARDRYVAPEMKNWTEIFRAREKLIVPAMIGNASVKLFLLDTGAVFDTITPTAAREVSPVRAENGLGIFGMSGDVHNVFIARDVTVSFGGVRQEIEGMIAFDSRALSHMAGAEISGIIGFPTLRDLVISIDYRDNLIHVVYDPKHGYHMH